MSFPSFAQRRAEDRAQLQAWTELPTKVAGAYLRSAESRARPLWFHAVGIAALVCVATKSIWCTPEKERR